LKVIREKCSEALYILDRFHIVAKMNKALDEVRAGESRRIAIEAARTNRLGALARTHGDLNALVIGTEAGVVVDKSAEAVASIQNRDQFHGASKRPRKLYHKPPYSGARFVRMRRPVKQ